MKQIIYILDGLTPYALLNFKKIYSRVKNKNNFINKLSLNSHFFSNSFGYGETHSTTYAFNTGENIYETNCDSFQSFNSFPPKKNLSLFFKKKKYKNVFFRNAHHESPIKGFYGRYLKAITNNFDYICLKKKSQNYTFSNFCDDQKLDLLINEKKDLMFYFHDFTLHDHKLVYKNSSPKKYLSAFNIASRIVEKNLNRLKFNEKEDILYFLSDHGMTYAPYEKMYFDKNFAYENHYNKLYAQDKIQTVFFVKFPKSEKLKIKKFLEPKNVYNLIQIYSNFYKEKILYKKIKKKLSNFIITSVKSPISDGFNNFLIKENFHTHLIYLSDKLKIAYALNHPIKCLDLDTSKHMNYHKIPKAFTIQIEKYFSKFNLFKKIAVYLWSILIRIYFKFF